jgi:hypothetical protein
MHGQHRCLPGKKKEVAFLKKSSAKNFCSSGPRAFPTPREAEQKFFGSFFQKRTACFLTFR